MRNFTNSEGAYKFNQLVSSRQNAVLGQHLGNGRVRLDSGQTVTAIIASGTPPGRVACFFDGQNWYAEASSGVNNSRTVIDKRYSPPVTPVGGWGLLYVLHLQPNSNLDSSTVSAYYAHWTHTGTTVKLLSANDDFWSDIPDGQASAFFNRCFYAMAFSQEIGVVALAGARTFADSDTPGVQVFEIIEFDTTQVLSRWRYEVPTTSYVSSTPIPYDGPYLDYLPSTLAFNNPAIAEELGIDLQDNDSPVNFGSFGLTAPDAQPLARLGGFCEDRNYYQFKPSVQVYTELEWKVGYMTNVYANEEKTIQQFTSETAATDAGVSVTNYLNFGSYSDVIRIGNSSRVFNDLYQVYALDSGDSGFGAEFRLAEFLENPELCFQYDKPAGIANATLPANATLIARLLNPTPYTYSGGSVDEILATASDLAVIRMLPYPL